MYVQSEKQQIAQSKAVVDGYIFLLLEYGIEYK